MAEIQMPCTNCIHIKVCGYATEMTRIIQNMNVDAVHFPGNMEVKAECKYFDEPKYDSIRDNY